MDAIWEYEHSVETKADLPFAWAFMSNVANWDDPPARFSLDGPFQSGSRGRTDAPGQPPRPWQLLNVKPQEGYTVQFPLDGATLSFAWHFGRRPGGGTHLGQRVSLAGDNAPAYLGDIRQVFTSNLAPGMDRIARAIDHAHATAPEST
jgi:hypothetical protein